MKYCLIVQVIALVSCTHDASFITPIRRAGPRIIKATSPDQKKMAEINICEKVNLNLAL